MRILVHDDPTLKVYLQAMGAAEVGHLDIPQDHLDQAFAHARKQHPEENNEQVRARAIARLACKLYGRKSLPSAAPVQFSRRLLIGFGASVIVLEVAILIVVGLIPYLLLR